MLVTNEINTCFLFQSKKLYGAERMGCIQGSTSRTRLKENNNTSL